LLPSASISVGRANVHRIQVEEDKHAKEVGSYLHPELFGQPAENQLALKAAARDS
jgi:hypothetical protein